jgi:hypothetical protein
MLLRLMRSSYTIFPFAITGQAGRRLAISEKVSKIATSQPVTQSKQLPSLRNLRNADFPRPISSEQVNWRFS